MSLIMMIMKDILTCEVLAYVDHWYIIDFDYLPYSLCWIWLSLMKL